MADRRAGPRAREGGRQGGARLGDKAKVAQTWRDCLAALTQAARGDGRLADTLGYLASAGLEHLGLPSHEVEEGILLIVSCVTNALTQCDEIERHRRCLLTVQILSCLLDKRAQKTVLSVAGVTSLCGTLTEWARGEVEFRRCSELANEAAWTLGFVVHSCRDRVNGDTASLVTSVLLTYLRQYGSISSVDDGHSHKTSGIPMVSPHLVCQAAFHALGLVFANGPPGTRQYEAVLSGTVGVLQRHVQCQGGPLEDGAACRMYCELLRLLAALVAEGKGAHLPQVPIMMECLSILFQYGASQSMYSRPPQQLGSPSPAPHSQPRSGSPGPRYTPPHMRRGSQSSSTSSASESDASDGDGSPGRSSADRFKSSRVRLAALSLLQVCAQSDGRSLHQHWMRLLPSRQPLQRWPHTPTLLTVLLYDPQQKVRAASAQTIGVLLEGRQQRSFLAVAKVDDSSSTHPLGRSFTSLSVSLGRMILSLHEGLHCALGQETRTNVILAVLRALASLVSSVHYDRLPADLPIQVSKVVTRCWHRLQSMDDRERAAEAAALSVLRLMLSAALPNAALRRNLSGEPDTIEDGKAAAAAVCSDHSHGGRGDKGLVDELVEVAGAGRAAVCSEALAVLAVVASHYFELLQGRWLQVSQLLRTAVGNHNRAEAFTADGKSAQNALRVVGALLAFGGKEEGGGSGDAGLKEQCDGAAPLWLEVVSVILPPALTHRSGPVRTAALAAAGAAGAWALGTLPPSDLRDLVQKVVDSGGGDAAASVKCGACRAIGSLVTHHCVLGQQDMFPSMASVITSCLSNTTLAVRISASWALANMCDALAAAHKRLAEAPISPAASDLATLAAPAIAAASDSEKVRANAVRAIGHLLGAAVFGPTGPRTSGTCRESHEPGAQASGTCEKSRDGQKSDGHEPGGVRAAFQATGCQEDSSESSRVRTQNQIPDLSDSSINSPANEDGNRKGNASVSGASTKFDSAADPQLPESHAWLGPAVRCLTSGMSAASAKVQWNSCYAAGLMAANPSALEAAHASHILEPILARLGALVCESGNFKVQTHAAAAIGAVPKRRHFGATYAGVLGMILSRLEALASGPQAEPIGSIQSSSVGGSDGERQGEEGRESTEDASFPNFRYCAALRGELEDTLLHLLTLNEMADDDAIRGVVLPHADLMATLLGNALQEGRGWEASRRCATAAASSTTSRAASDGRLAAASELASGGLPPIGDGQRVEIGRVEKFKVALGVRERGPKDRVLKTVIKGLMRMEGEFGRWGRDLGELIGDTDGVVVEPSDLVVGK